MVHMETRTKVKAQRVLLIEDDEDDFLLVTDLFSDPPLRRFTLDWVGSYDAALKAIVEQRHDVYILDYRLGERNGLELMDVLKERSCNVPVIVLTGCEDYEVDLEAMRAGASDYLVKGRISADLLERSIRYSIDRKASEQALQQQLARIQLLNQIVRSIADRQDLESIFSIVIGHLEDHLPADYGGIFLMDRESGSASLKSRSTKNRILVQGRALGELSLEAGDVYLTSACSRNELVYLPELQGSHEGMAARLAKAGFRSMVVMPLRVESSVLGVLVLARLGPQAFSDEEHAFIRALSEHVALAAHHTGLYEDLWEAYSELRETQQSAMQQERMRALGQMASGIAHDINNALSPIVGFTDVLIEHEKDLSDRARNYLEMIRLASADIGHIVSQMREFYRERGDPHELIQVNLNRTVKQVVDLTRPSWRDIPQRSGIVITVRTQLEHDLPVVAGIESEIREALTNLILNAVDAMPEGGSIQVRTRKDGERILLDVQDTGMGMTEATRLRCLEPLYTTKGERGTGMGLAMVYGIMQRHEGEIRIESQLEHGTKVSLVFPMRVPGESGGVEPEVRGTSSRLRILCIDDEPLVRLVLKEMLESEGHTAESADGGKNGLNMFFEALQVGRPFDLVMTDLGMPYLDGREVVRRIKHDSPQTPVILLTGWGGRMKAEESIPSSVDYILAKPPTVNKIREALRKLGRP